MPGSPPATNPYRGAPFPVGELKSPPPPEESQAPIFQLQDPHHDDPGNLPSVLVR